MKTVATVRPTPVANVAATAPQPSSNLVAADTLTTPMRSLLQAYNLADLWRGCDPEARDSTASVLDGFFGPDHYRISFVFTQVLRDNADPSLFHVSGKNRYKQQVTPFNGVLRVTKLADLEHRYLDLVPEDSLTQGYTATASFTLQESAATSNAGKFIGTGILDFYLIPPSKVGYAQIMGGEDGPARGQGLLFKGHWTSSKTGQEKELLVARDVFSIAPDVLKNFAIGERDATINPKYAKLGWDKYWENDEWWAETSKSSLSL